MLESDDVPAFMFDEADIWYRQELRRRQMEMPSLYARIPGDTWIRQMYLRWRIMSSIEACQRGRTLESEFYNTSLGVPYFREADLNVPLEFASDGILKEAMPISRRSFDRPVTVKNGEEVSIQFEFEIKEPKGSAMFGYIPQPPSEPEIVCPCCKGSGTYTGFIKVEPCGECKGTGKVKGSKPADNLGAKGSADIDYSALGLMRQDREFG